MRTSWRSCTRKLCSDLNQSLAGVVGRSWSNSEPKYLNSMSELGFQRSFYNAHKLAKLHKKIMYTVVLTEGALDALAIERAGYTFSLGTFGDVLTEEQISLLEGVRHITQFADNDSVGIKAALKNADALSRPYRTFCIAYSKRKEKDASELAETGHSDLIGQYVMNSVRCNELTCLRLRTEFELMRSR